MGDVNDAARAIRSAKAKIVELQTEKNALDNRAFDLNDLIKEAFINYNKAERILVDTALREGGNA